MRNEVRLHLLQHRFAEEYEALRDRWASFADEVYRDVYGSQLELLESLPDGWVPVDGDLSVRIQGTEVTLYFNGQPSKWNRYGEAYEVGEVFGYRDAVHRRVAHVHERGYAKVYEAKDVIAISYQKLENVTTDFKELFTKTSKEIGGILGSFAAVHTLREAWPEIGYFLDRYQPVEKRVLPAVRTAQLNELLRLPVAEAA